MSTEFRTGIGFDVHAFADNRKLIIGGVEIPNEKGLLGHSDADVLIHAICDALLGSLALGDIGLHFPDKDAQFNNADSRFFLKKVYELIKKEGYLLGNIDAVIAMQTPKISPFVSEMRKRIAEDLHSDINQISIKATTTEKLGFIGREEGVSAFVTVLIIKNN